MQYRYLSGIDLTGIQAVVLSHGHFDHTAGLPNLLARLGSQQVSLIFHPCACLERKVVMPGGHERDVSPPKIADLQQENVPFIEKQDPTLLVDNMGSWCQAK